jgi:hypothetical protein
VVVAVAGRGPGLATVDAGAEAAGGFAEAAGVFVPGVAPLFSARGAALGAIGDGAAAGTG